MSKFNKLSRAEMKNVLGGDDQIISVIGANGCCAHNADWSQSQCGYPDGTQAEAAASSAAQQDQSQHWYWCCQSCI